MENTNDVPVLIDGQINDNLNARGLNKPIAELWAYILQHGGLKLQAIQAVGTSPNFVCQTMSVKKTNPFYSPEDKMFALSQYKNPYQKNRNMGMADNIGIDITAETYLEFTVYPGQNLLSLYFDRMV